MMGIFDSGAGGLTVLRAIREVLPSADVLYFGDTKNAPYGSKSREELFQLTVQAMKFLSENGAGSIVSACNSVSASLAISLFDTFSLTPQNLIEMVGPTVSTFKGSSDRLVLVATPATIQSGIYQNAFRMIGKDVQCLAIPELAGAIEHGETEEKIENIIRAGLDGTDFSSFDTLILACTHYPLVLPTFKKVCGSSVHVFDPAETVALRVESRFWPREVGNGTTRFALSQDSKVFRDLAATLFPKQDYSIEVLK